MRFVTQILLGLIVFNSMLVMTSPFFPTTYVGETPYDAVDIVNTTNYSQYGEINIDFWGTLFGGGEIAAITMGGSLIIGLGVAWATKSMIPIGIAAFAGLVTTLFMTASSVLYGLSQNIYIQGLIAVIGIVIGILIAFTMAESMMGQTGAD